MLLRVLVISRPASPSPRVSSLYTELFLFSLPPKTSLPHESRTCRLYLRVCTRNIKSPRVYTFTFVRVRHAFFRVPFLSVPSFLFFFFLSPAFHSFRSSIHLACFQPSTVLFSSFDSRYLEPQTFDTVLWNGALSVPYTIPHRDLCAYRTQENTDCHLRNASPLYLYRRCINFYKKIDRANINFTIEWKTMFAV